MINDQERESTCKNINFTVHYITIIKSENKINIIRLIEKDVLCSTLRYRYHNSTTRTIFHTIPLSHFLRIKYDYPSFCNNNCTETHLKWLRLF